MNLEQHIEAILFYKSDPVEKAELARLLAVELGAIEAAIETLSAQYATRGIRLIQTDYEVQLVTAPECAPLIESVRKHELKKDIGKAGAETLAIILYRGPITRTEIDTIRGVNSNFIIRNLMTRGLIEREQQTADTRSFKYVITPALLAHLGIGAREELPQFTEIMDALDAYEGAQQKEAETTMQ